MSSELSDSQIEEQITKIYQKILKRKPDPSGLKYYLEKVKTKKIQLDYLPSILMRSPEYKKIEEKAGHLAENQKFVKKPIFIIGVARSGTTLLYNIMCAHPSLGWFSAEDLEYWIPKTVQKKIKIKYTLLKKTTKKFPQDESAFVAFGPEYIAKFRPPNLPAGNVPIEGDTFWSKHFGRKFLKDLPFGEEANVIKDIKSVLERQKKARFLNKAPSNCMRLFALQKIFPDAKFINIARDPRAVINSMIQRYIREGGFDPGVPVRDLKKYETLDYLQKWAWRYKEITNYIYDFSIKNEDNFLTIIYEELASNPKKVMQKILSFCELEFPKSFKQMIPPIWKKPANKWMQTLSESDEKKIIEIVSPSIQKMNYPYKL